MNKNKNSGMCLFKIGKFSSFNCFPLAETNIKLIHAWFLKFLFCYSVNRSDTVTLLYYWVLGGGVLGADWVICGGFDGLFLFVAFYQNVFFN